MKNKLKNVLHRPIVYTLIFIALFTILSIALTVLSVYLNRVYYSCGTFASCSVIDNLSNISNDLLRVTATDFAFVARLIAEFSLILLVVQLFSRLRQIEPIAKTK